MNPEQLIRKYCGKDDELYNVLLTHSQMVANLATRIADNHPELGIDRQFVYEAAMLHDIGIVKCDAPGIHCHGVEPYLKHGLLGGEILRNEGLPRHARVAERHTGTGLTAESIVQQNLPLPPMDLCPETIEEQLICYADKFFSKTKLERQKSIEQARKSLAKFGPENIAKFGAWYELFGVC